MYSDATLREIERRLSRPGRERRVSIDPMSTHLRVMDEAWNLKYEVSTMFFYEWFDRLERHVRDLTRGHDPLGLEIPERDPGPPPWLSLT